MIYLRGVYVREIFQTSRKWHKFEDRDNSGVHHIYVDGIHNFCKSEYTPADRDAI